MPTSRTSSSLNTRVFAPTVILSQDTRRLFITLKSTGDGYTMDSGITCGHAIRYNPGNNSYVRCDAKEEVGSEVVGVVESTTGGANPTFVVVTAGSIHYPTDKLNTIFDENGVTASIDVLFLDPAVIGGLTGTINLPAAGEDPVIVKPVIQLAPHSVYNGIVVNYIGYKIGDEAKTKSMGQPVGSLLYGPENTDFGSNYNRADTDFELSATEYSTLFGVYGTSYGDYTVELTLTTNTNINSALLNKTVQSFSTSLVTIGTVTAYNYSNNTITILRTKDSAPIINGSTIYCNGNAWTLSSSTVKTFTVPAVGNSYKQGTTTIVPYMAIEPTTTVSIPNSLGIEDLTVTGTLEVGAITDLETTVNNLQTQINNIKTILRIEGA
jgi:hypothetical protein